MATIPHCHYCFETLTAYLEHRTPLQFAKIEELYEKHQRKLHAHSQKLPNGLANGVGAANQVNGNGVTTNGYHTPVTTKYPLFITWKTRSKSGRMDLRGCIGTFEKRSLETGLKDYALTAGLHDSRFDPITAHELPSLECSVTLLENFEPAEDAYDWVLGTHGLQIEFSYHNRRMGATYLPDVPTEQQWTQEETLISLMRKAGWTGKKDDWKKVDLKITRYQGSKASVSWREYKELLGDISHYDEDDLEDGVDDELVDGVEDDD